MSLKGLLKITGSIITGGGLTAGDGPEVVLPVEIVKFAGNINAEIDFDLYYYENQ